MMKKILLMIAVVVIVIMFTSFNRSPAPSCKVDMAEAPPMLLPFDRVEYVPNSEKKLSVPYINQLEAYPNGCEAVSTVMVLQYLGIDISVDDFIDKYLDTGDTPSPSKNTGPDPDRVYCGDPRSEEGWGCNSPVIVNALNKFMSTDEYITEHSYGRAMEDLCYDYIDRDIPVLVWVTVAMEDSSDISNYRTWTTPEGKEISYNRRLHCMVLCGYDEENYYFNDPMTQALMAYPKAEAEKAYSILGMQSVAIMQNA